MSSTTVTCTTQAVVAARGANLVRAVVVEVAVIHAVADLVKAVVLAAVVVGADLVRTIVGVAVQDAIAVVVVRYPDWGCVL